MAEESSNISFFAKVLGWPAVSGVILLMLGTGATTMTTPHAYVADGFFVAGVSILLVKFWTWEGTNHETPRKTALLLAGGTLVGLLVLFGALLLTWYMSKPSPSAMIKDATTAVPPSHGATSSDAPGATVGPSMPMRGSFGPCLIGRGSRRSTWCPLWLTKLQT